MLKEASISEMSQRRIPRECRVLVNRGRGNDELAPSEQLYGEMRKRKTELEGRLGRGGAEAHNRAFLDCDFERRFREQVTGDPAAMGRLREIAARSGTEDVYLICYEGPAKACHRRILMRIAQESFQAAVEVTGVEPGP